ncbi:hypothetical protein JXE04_01345 [Patescibacteria group bacterium]|nr:hypothetical protein [Patescibacteria group bacterium]
MKRIIFIALSVLFIFLSAQAQVIIKNPGSYTLEVSANGSSTLINPGQNVRVNFVHPGEKEVKFFCRYYEGNKLNSFRLTTDIVGDNISLSPSTTAVISDNKRTKKMFNNSAQTNQTKATEQYTDDFIFPDAVNTPLNIPTQPVVVVNGSSKKWITNSNSSPFVGISLAPGDESEPVNLSPGLYQFTVTVDQDQSDASTGRNFTQAVIKFILVQGATEIKITDDNITPIGGKITKVILASTFSEKIVFVGSTMYGRAIKSSSRLQGKVNLTIGFNSISVQFYYKGARYQADLEFIVAEGERVVVIGRQNIKNIIQIN